VNCRVPPTTTLGVDEVTETDARVLIGGVLATPPHPVFTISSGRKKRQTRMENNEPRRMAKCISPPKRARNMAPAIVATTERNEFLHSSCGPRRDEA
jgi:hypothetical protein